MNAPRPAALLLLAACTARPSGTDSLSDTPDTHDTGLAPWGYGADDGPDTWAEDYPDCGGSQQSPIDLDTDRITYAELPPLTLQYVETTLRITNTGHTVEYDVDPGSTLSLDGILYELEQFHVHTPSEHGMNGIHPDLELHLVHTRGDQHVVVALFVNGDDSNPGFEESFTRLGWDALPAAGESYADPDVLYNLVDLFSPIILADGFERVSYAGSLTTPPCTESVIWVISVLIPTVPRAQVAQFQALYTDNHRPVVDQGERVVTWDTSP